MHPLLPLSDGKAVTRAGDQTQSVDWVFTVPMTEQWVFNKNKISKKGKERDNSPSKQTCYGLSVLARLWWEPVAKLSLCAEFSSFLSCQRKYRIKTIIRCSKKTYEKMAKEIKSNLQNIPTASHWCWQGGGEGLEAKLLPWAEFSPFSSWHTKYVIENIIRCCKKNMSKKCGGN